MKVSSILSEFLACILQFSIQFLWSQFCNDAHFQNYMFAKWQKTVNDPAKKMLTNHLWLRAFSVSEMCS